MTKKLVTWKNYSLNSNLPIVPGMRHHQKQHRYWKPWSQAEYDMEMGGNGDETAGYVSFLSTTLTCTGSNSQDRYPLEQRIMMQKESEVQRSQIIIPTSRKLRFTYIVNFILLCTFLGFSSLRMRHSFPPIRIQKPA